LQTQQQYTFLGYTWQLKGGGNSTSRSYAQEWITNN